MVNANSLYLSITPAIECPCVVAEPLAVAGTSGEQNVVHGDHGHVLLATRVAAIRQS